MFRFLVADDHPLFRDALASMLDQHYPASEIHESENLAQTLEKLAKDDGFDLLLLDLNMPGMNGLSALLELRNTYPDIPIAIISAETNKQVILQTLSYGAVGYIAKASPRPEMLKAITEIMNGSVYLPADIIRAAHCQPDTERAVSDHSCISADLLHTLTRRQLLVLKAMTQGAANKQIAYDMNISETTVKSHVSAILKKLGVTNRTQAVVGVTHIDFDDYLKR